MKKWYFSFGSDPGFPYQNTHVIVIADTEHEAVAKFRAKFPDRHENTVNCAFWYPEERWHGSMNEALYGDPAANTPAAYFISLFTSAWTFE